MKRDTIKGLPRANSTATPLGPLVVVQAPPRKGRKGPAPGKLARYRESDRACYAELEWLMREECLSASAAARELAEAGKVEGVGSPESRARRLVKLYRADSR